MAGSAQVERGNEGIGAVVFSGEDRQEQSTEVDAPREAGSLPIVIPCSSSELSQAAMKVVADLSRHLRISTTLIAVQIVPYTLPLDSPPVSSAFYRRRLEEVVSACPVPVRIELLLARDRETALKQFLSCPSLILIVSRKEHWWRKTAEEQLASALRRARHTVALVTIE